MRMNAAMTGLVGSEAELRAATADVTLVPELRACVDGGLVAENGATYLASARPPLTKPYPIPPGLDLTGAECFVNHVHVGAQGLPRLSPRALLLQAFRYAFELSALLQGRPFRTIVARSPEHGWTVRFHERRAGEAWLEDDPDRHGDEAIAFIDTGPAS